MSVKPMTDDDYKLIMERLGMPNSLSLLEALKQVANHTAQAVEAEGAAYLARIHSQRKQYLDGWDRAIDKNNKLTADLARLTAELEKEKAQSRHLAEAMSSKIEELIASENQCSYYKTQYTRAEQTRKEACYANLKAQTSMLWLTAELERSQRECEGLREVFDKARHYAEAWLTQAEDRTHCICEEEHMAAKALDDAIKAVMSAGGK